MATRSPFRAPSLLGSCQCQFTSSYRHADTSTPRVSIRWSSSNSRWKQRQGRDMFAREAKVQGLKSRAAFKLLEMDAKYRLFKPGQTVVDLGYAPGSWSQPPRGVATFQGDFLSPRVRALVREFLSRTGRADKEAGGTMSYIDRERRASEESEEEEGGFSATVDVVLSDMSAPWVQTSGFTSNTLTNPYHRLMNTSGVAFRDHAGSMDLCAAALQFASDTLRPGGHFVCKFYQGGEDKKLETRLRGLFARVFREKPESSRSESKEAYFIALKRRAGVAVDSGDAV
ncbi:ribosomal RNA methyltransferase MRM2 [Metarhizium rileyi]|uniref:rRNA methyltransferase 2, mitochondrial n=1 Tax=Metarhizium rileyi (strain RCEF 4871) TaxID=1649241 RepID=A0A166WS77_METRR|nr:ribosomal RNA methyltransferase MRM2 [Metarhizium rileyi RCEF 4871]